MPAQTEVKLKYERVEQDKNFPHAGMRVFAYIDLQTEFLRLHREDEGHPVFEWTKSIMEQVWLALIKAGQPVSDVTWVVNNDWYAGDRFHQDGVRRAEDDDLVYWAKEHMPAKTPIIVVLVTERSNGDFDKAMNNFSNIATFHRLQFQSTDYDETADLYDTKVTGIYCNVPESYYEYRKPVAHGQRAGQ